MVGRWDQKDIPHKGWSCVGMEDREMPDAHCEMCGKEDVRYVHFMQHPNYRETLEVGCVCAEKMEDECGREKSRARRREAKLKNSADRRKRWPKLSGWKPSAKGNMYITKNNRRVVIFKHGLRFKFFIEDRRAKYFSPRSYLDTEEAKLAAFDAFTYQHED